MTQWPSSGGHAIRRGPVNVSVGLDFGTHSTKAVFFELGAGARIFRPVSFEHGLARWPTYTLPGLGTIRKGALVWGAEAAALLENKPWNEGIRRLKVLVAAAGGGRFGDTALYANYVRELERSHVDIETWRPEHVVVAALACQMAEVRLRLERHYGVRDFDAQFAIPVPIDQAQHSGVLALYQRVANATQRLLTPDQRLTVSATDLVPAAAEAFAQAPATEDFSGRLFLLPEAVAQIASYMTSLEATGGVHGVIDIGAGTTDVSVFMLERPRNQVTTCYWYGALAIPKASAFVQDAVAAAIPNSDWMTESELLSECSSQVQVVSAALRQIKKLSNEAWTDAFGHLKEQHRWSGCPIFLCGGGAALPGVKAVFKESWTPGWDAHEIWELPVPQEYNGGDVPFSRMAVAYGLAIPKPLHGEFVLPKDAPNHTPPALYNWRYYVARGEEDPEHPRPRWV